MPHVHNISTRINGRRASASFWVERTGRWFPIPRVHQLDGHSCGFLAVLVVVQHFDPSTTVRQVLEALPKGYLPSPMWGLSGHGIRKTLSRFGIECPSVKGLRMNQLLMLVLEGHPVMVTVLPPDWDCDHWAVIRGMSAHRVWLSNYSETDSGSVSWNRFRHMWSPHGEAMVCRKA